MPRSRGDKGTPKDTEPPQKGKGGHEEGEKPPKAPEDVGAQAPKNSGSESRHGGHGQKSGKKGPADPHAAATKTYSPFLNTVFGKVGTPGGDMGMRVGKEGPWNGGDVGTVEMGTRIVQDPVDGRGTGSLGTWSGTLWDPGDGEDVGTWGQ